MNIFFLLMLYFAVLQYNIGSTINLRDQQDSKHIFKHSVYRGNKNEELYRQKRQIVYEDDDYNDYTDNGGSTPNGPRIENTNRGYQTFVSNPNTDNFRDRTYNNDDSFNGNPHRRWPNHHFNSIPDHNFFNSIPNHNFNSRPNQNFNSRPNHNFNSRPNQNFNSRPNQNFNSGSNQNFNSRPNQNFNSGPNQNFNSRPNQNFNSRPNQNFNSRPNQNFNSIPNQNFNSISNQNFFDNQNFPDNNIQSVTTQRPAIVPGGGTTKSPCEDRCKITQQFDPVCGDNMVTYTNEQWLRCAQNCGIRVNVLRRTACPRFP